MNQRNISGMAHTGDETHQTVSGTDHAAYGTHQAIRGAEHAADEARNVNSRRVLENPELYAQFIRDHIKIPELANVQPEDIEDVSERYQMYLGIEFEADTVKKIHLRNISAGAAGGALGEDAVEADSVYLISLVEHKSRVDYDVAMQLLRYIVCIWDDYAREMEKKQEGITRQKRFRYPPILPIVYYEGRASWSADMRLSDRIWMSETLGKYMPDFTYQVVRIHDYSNEELMRRGDAISLIMMINKIQSPEDLTRFWQSSPERMDEILKNTEGNIREIIKDVMYSLLMKMKVPVGEAKQYVEMIEECHMGYLFENMEEMDIQAERRKYAEAKKEAEEAQREAEEAQREAEEAQREAEEAQREAEEAQREAEEAQREAEEAQRERDEVQRERDEVQKERDEAQKERDEVQKKADEVQKEARKEVADAQKRAAEAEEGQKAAEDALEKVVKSLVDSEWRSGCTKRQAVSRVARICNLPEKEIENLIGRIEK